jgi:quaternary ammonium compound-resistance protein SugE
MAWIVLFVAGLFEVGWAVGLKYTEGFSRLWPSVGTVASMIVSLGLLGLALRTLPLGTAYAIWTGVGTVGTALLGITLFHEAADPIRLVCIGLILAGIVGLKHQSFPPQVRHHQTQPSDVPTGARQVRDQSAADRVAGSRHDDRDLCSRSIPGKGR